MDPLADSRSRVTWRVHAITNAHALKMLAMIVAMSWARRAGAKPGSAVTSRCKAGAGGADAPTDILNVHQVFAPGAHSGWHTSTGPGLLIVEQGTITIEETEGGFVDYPQGTVLFEREPDRVHDALNRTADTVILDAWFLRANTPRSESARGAAARAAEA